jgi:predicted ATPase
VDANLVLPIVARTLGVKETAGKSLLQALADHLREREILLVLDNLEQLDEAAPAVSEVLHSGPKLKLLVTSRAPLHVLGEREYAVPPLRLPQRQTIGEVAMLSQYESVALFVERAQAVKADFALTSENGPAVAEICVKLDGLPLAIELAAARLRILPPRTLLARLDRRLKLLTGGARDAPERQQTLRAAIDWSYSLLAEEEERLFAQLSVFVGGCTLEAAEDIFNRLREPAVDVLDGLTSLVEKNLLRKSESESGEPRFSMLETIREYAAERLDELADAEEVRRAHADYFRRSCEEARPHLRGGERQAFWLDWLETEHDNVRAALTFCRRDPDAQLAIVASLEWFWYQRGYWKEAEQWLEEALGRSDRADQQRLRVLEGAYYVAYIQGKDDRARTLLDEMLALARHLRDREGIAAALHGLANLAIGEGKTEEATALEEESLSFCEGERYSLFPLTGLGFQAFFRSDYATARELFERAIAVGRAFDDQAEVTNALALLATVTAYQGQEREALALLGESVKLARELGSPVALVTRVLPGFAAVRAVRGDTEEALRIIGASTALREELGSAGGPVSTELKRRIVEAAKRDLDDDQIAAALEAGRSLTLDDALAYALEDEIAATRARDG